MKKVFIGILTIIIGIGVILFIKNKENAYAWYNYTFVGGWVKGYGEGG